MDFLKGATFLALFVVQVVCKRYDIHRNWNLEETGVVYLSPKSNSFGYTVVSNGSMDIVSDNGNFALALWGNRSIVNITENFTGSFFNPISLAVIMLKTGESHIAAVPVWKFDLYVYGYGWYFQYYGYERPRRIAKVLPWSEIVFNSLELNDTGNLVLYRNSVVTWQSFEHPTDILLPGQLLKSGMNLTSHPYISKVVPGGLVLYMDTQDFDLELYQQQSYGVWSLESRGESSVRSVLKTACPGYEAVLHYTGKEIYLSYEPVAKNVTVCSISKLVLTTSTSTSSVLPYLGLDNHGDLVLYRYDSNSSDWVADVRFSDSWGGSSCKLPSACGDYSICDPTNKNVCEYYEGVSPYYCNPRTLYGVGYPSMKFAEPILPRTSAERCERSAGWNMFYDNSTGECFAFSRLYGSLRRDNDTRSITAFVCQYVIIDNTFPAGVIFLSILAGLWLLAMLALALVKHGILAETKHKLQGWVSIVKYYVVNYFSKAVREVESLLSTMQGLPRRYTYLELESATKGFTMKLGAGAFGTVYEGMTSDGRHVAVKKLGQNATDSAKQFVTELVGVGGISHLNVVKLYGFCIEGANKKLLVYEFMPNGSLDRWIFRQDACLSWQQRVDIALGTTRGLAYLHQECSEPILHLDVKPQNILLDEKFAAKVADFGMAKLLTNREVTQVETGARGTPGYLAPEWMVRGVATKKCDVYSYGMVLLELVGGRKNIDWERVSEPETEDVWYFPSWVVNQVKNNGDVFKVVDEKIRASAMEQAGQQVKNMVYIALWCIQDIAPSMHEIVEMLEGRRSVGEPPMSFHFDAQTDDIVKSVVAVQSEQIVTVSSEHSSLLR